MVYNMYREKARCCHKGQEGVRIMKAKQMALAICMGMFAAGVAYCEDPYIESTGAEGMSTGYRMKGSSRVEVDFAVADLSNPATYRIFGSVGGGYESALVTTLYISGTTHFYFVVGQNEGASPKYYKGLDTDRHTAIIDIPRDQIMFVTGGVTNDGHLHAYQAIAVYDDFYGVTREGEPSASATITSEPLGMVITVK